MPFTWKKCGICFACWPFVLTYQSCRIYVLGCLAILLSSCWGAFAHCCCACWAALCCACCGCQPQFTDREFPPNAKSLGREEASVEWRRLDDYFQEMEDADAFLFCGDIQPSDVSQGGLGDCWLMSSIAALADHPAMIRRLFVTKSYSAYGKYTIRLYDGVRGRWTRVVVDNYIPVMVVGRASAPLYANMSGPEMWAVLLEKAVAKFCGSFSAIEGGSATWALHTLTGYPTFCIRRGEENPKEWTRFNFRMHENAKNRRDMTLVSTPEVFDPDRLFAVLLEYALRNAIMCASSNTGSDTQTNAMGVVLGHAYSIINVRRVEGFRLLHLRNPWGTGEWKGAWGDTCPNWQRHPAVRKACGFEPADDGNFWLTIEDFMANFRSVNICSRKTGFKDLAVDPCEGRCCGPCLGCVAGCFCFWCGCRGCKALCCGEDASADTVRGEEFCCV